MLGIGILLGLALAVLLLIGLCFLASNASEATNKSREAEERMKRLCESEKSRARQTVLDMYASLGAKLGPTVSPSWIQQRIVESIDSSKIPESGKKQEGPTPNTAAAQICDELRRMAAWAQLRREWQRHHSRVQVEFPQMKLEEFIEKNLGHDQPADTVESAAKGMIEWFSSMPWAPSSPLPSADPLATKKEALRQQRDQAVQAARTSGDEPFVIEARCEQLRQEYTEALLRIERMSA